MNARECVWVYNTCVASYLGSYPEEREVRGYMCEHVCRSYELWACVALFSWKPNFYECYPQGELYNYAFTSVLCSQPNLSASSNASNSRDGRGLLENLISHNIFQILLYWQYH